MAGYPHNPDNNEMIRSLMGPQATQQAIMSAIMMCWQSLPEEKRTVYNLEKEFMKIADRTFKDIREDSETFGFQ